MEDPHTRVLPDARRENEFFWTSGADGELRFLRCAAATYYMHPPAPLPGVRRRDARARGGERPRHGPHLHREPPGWDGTTDPYVIAIVAHPRAAGRAPHDEHRRLRARRRAHRHAGARCVFERPRPTSGSRSSSRDARERVDDAFERRSVISGIGQSAIGRRLDRDRARPHDRRRARGDRRRRAHAADIDGLATYPGGGCAGAGGFAGPGHARGAGRAAAGAELVLAAVGGAGAARAVINAVLAVGAGLARHVLVFRTVTEATAQGSGGRRRASASARRRRAVRRAPLQWTLPFRAYSAANWLAMNAQRHFHEFGTTPRAARADRPQRPPQRRAQPEGDLPRADDARRLLRARA